jgi:hypothetical protein
VDAYTGYIMRLSEARTSELRREAAEYTLSSAFGTDDTSLWARAVSRLARRPRASVRPATPSVAALALQSAPSGPAA